MFDPVTAAFVRSASPLLGLDPETLAEELTAAYVDIASARLMSRDNIEGQRNLQEVVSRMSRLADAYEAEIVLDVQSERRRSIAFVAGSARQVLTQVSRLTESGEGTSILHGRMVAPEIAASLLFLIAQRSSDAYEASRDIRASGEDNALRRGLILAIRYFCSGQFSLVKEIDINSERLDENDQIEYATDLLFREVLRGIHLLASAGLGEAGPEGIEAALDIFREVQKLSVEEFDDNINGTEVSAISAFPGPHHLAALLEKAAGSFGDDILISTPPPKGTDSERWREWLTNEANRWPFLWENHRDAIATGYLDKGASLVMTTPTGSGKSTLAALKIAATLATGKTVLYLAPTHALVGQVESDLNDRVVGLAKAVSIEDFGLDQSEDGLPDIAVVTPERCFALLTFAPEIFTKVGLLVFDEFHLLGTNISADGIRNTRVDRRSIDAMLCLLSFQSINNNADYLLLSAMVSNGKEIAEWLQSITGRAVIPFDYKWKPTRQLRSCVLYDKTELTDIRLAARRKPPVRKIEAIPYGLFSLSSGWNPGASDKLMLRAFSPEPVALKRTENLGGAYLTANRFEVAATIAKRFADSGLKVVVFCDSIVNCGSVAARINKQYEEYDSERDEKQELLRDSALLELGSERALYDSGTRVAAVHHGELLSSERKIVEGLFRRRDGNLRVLAATSTLAQGLNLPCDVVILASIDRLDESDPEDKTRTALQPHEILNALGRAGRAGQAATGYSIVIPSSPIWYDPGNKRVEQDDEIRLVFAEGDQCLPLADPISVLFDLIEIGGASGPDSDYLIRRLATSLGEEREGTESFESLAKRTFGYFQKSKLNSQQATAWLESRKVTLTGMLSQIERQQSLPWQEELAAKTGASTRFILKLAGTYESAPFDAVHASEWLEWLINLFDPSDADTDIFLRFESVIRVFGRAITVQNDEVAARKVAIEGTRSAIKMWFEGRSLCEMEQAISEFIARHEGDVKRKTKADVKAKRARRFAIRIAPDFGFLCGVLSQVAQRMSTDKGLRLPPIIGFLPQLVRYGFETPYHLILSRVGNQNSRAHAIQSFDVLAPHIVMSSDDDHEAIRQKLQHAQAISVFSVFEPDDLDEALDDLQSDLDDID